jgi:hypothetical protein
MFLVITSGRAQQAKVARSGLTTAPAPDVNPFVAALRAGLADLGYVEGRNVTITARYADGDINTTACRRARETAGQRHSDSRHGDSPIDYRPSRTTDALANRRCGPVAASRACVFCDFARVRTSQQSLGSGVQTRQALGVLEFHVDWQRPVVILGSLRMQRLRRDGRS